MASTDMFLKLKGVEGESEDDKHGKEIEISSWSWGAQNTGTFSAGGGGGSGKVMMQDFHFTAKLSKATANLMQRVCNGEHISEATLSCRKSSGKPGQQDYLIIKFYDCLVASYQTGGSGGSDPVPVESFALNFAKVEFEYKPQKKDGSFDGSVKANWDQKTNKAV